MFRRCVPLALAALSTACATTPDRLGALDRRFYYALDNSEDQQAFLESEPDRRRALLENRGMWADWVRLTDAERAAAKQGRVEVGFRGFAARMAWGVPADTRQSVIRGQEIRLETYIRCISGPKIDEYVRQNADCDGSSSELQVAIHDGIITEINYLD